MTDTQALDRLVRQVVGQVRWRRAEHYGLRGLFWGLCLALVPLIVKGPLVVWGLPLGAAAIVLGTVGGFLYGFVRPIAPLDAARLADRAFGLADRVSTALEYARQPETSGMVASLLGDAESRAGQVRTRQIVRRVFPRELPLMPVPLVIAIALVLAPPLPLPSGRLFDTATTTEAEETKERGDTAMLEDKARPLPKDPLKRPAFEERDYVQRGATGAPAAPGDLAAIFKDTSLSTQRPDFNSFLKKGDERLKMLEQLDRLPDLQSDFTTNQYKMVFRKSKELRGGLRPDQISPEKLRELLQEMERLGRKGNQNWSQDAQDGMEALEGGQPDRALSAMEKALDKMRAAEEAKRSGKNLRGGRDDRRQRGEGGKGGGPEDQDFGEGDGLMPGKGKSGSPKGEATQRLRANPFDAGVEGESRRGRKDGYDTNMTGRGGRMESRMQYLGVIGQYRKMMEDSIAREQVPRDYHGQIKDYFQALDER
jgi:hypothetical protein